MPFLQTIPEELKLNKICRACLGEKGDMRPLYGSCLDDMLRAVAQVKVQIGDGLPESLCLQCVLQVSRAFRFKQQCERSDHTLRNYIGQEEIKINDNDNFIIVDSTNSQEPESGLGQHITNSTQDDKSCLLIFEELNGEQQNLLAVATGQNSAVIENDDIVQGQINAALGIVLDEETIKIENFTVQHNAENGIHSSEIFYEDNMERDDEIFETIPSEECYSNENDEKDHEFHLHPTISFKCQVCSKEFPKRRMWRRHMKIHDPVKPHVCKECGMSFTEGSNLKKHIKKHTGELRNVVGKPNLCSVCGKGFKWASSLSKHMNHHTKKKILNCPHCPKYYVENRSLRIHLRTHTGEKPYVCDVCDKGFTQMCNLEKHIRVHTGEKPFLCPICGKGFSQSGYVAVHLRSHTGEKPYLCTICGKTFAGSNSLTIHKRIHTGEKPFVCNICNKAYGRQESLAMHLRTHTGEKSHTCSICNRGFTCSSHLTIHMRTHTGEKPYVCKICSRKFVSCNSLKSHAKSHKDVHQAINPNDVKIHLKTDHINGDCNNQQELVQSTIVIVPEQIVQEDSKHFSILTLNQ